MPLQSDIETNLRLIATDFLIDFPDNQDPWHFILCELEKEILDENREKTISPFFEHLILNKIFPTYTSLINYNHENPQNAFSFYWLSLALNQVLSNEPTSAGDVISELMTTVQNNAGDLPKKILQTIPIGNFKGICPLYWLTSTFIEKSDVITQKKIIGLLSLIVSHYSETSFSAIFLKYGDNPKFYGNTPLYRILYVGNQLMWKNTPLMGAYSSLFISILSKMDANALDVYLLETKASNTIFYVYSNIIRGLIAFRETEIAIKMIASFNTLISTCSREGLRKLLDTKPEQSSNQLANNISIGVFNAVDTQQFTIASALIDSLAVIRNRAGILLFNSQIHLSFEVSVNQKNETTNFLSYLITALTIAILSSHESSDIFCFNSLLPFLYLIVETNDIVSLLHMLFYEKTLMSPNSKFTTPFLNLLYVMSKINDSPLSLHPSSKIDKVYSLIEIIFSKLHYYYSESSELKKIIFASFNPWRTLASFEGDLSVHLMQRLLDHHILPTAAQLAEQKLVDQRSKGALQFLEDKNQHSTSTLLKNRLSEVIYAKKKYNITHAMAEFVSAPQDSAPYAGLLLLCMAGPRSSKTYIPLDICLYASEFLLTAHQLALLNLILINPSDGTTLASDEKILLIWKILFLEYLENKAMRATDPEDRSSYQSLKEALSPITDRKKIYTTLRDTRDAMFSPAKNPAERAGVIAGGIRMLPA